MKVKDVKKVSGVQVKVDVRPEEIQKKMLELLSLGLTQENLEEYRELSRIKELATIDVDELTGSTKKRDVKCYTAEEYKVRKEAVREPINKPVVKNTTDALKHLTGEDNVDHFGSVLSEMLYIYAKKNADYGNSFDKSLDEDGLLVAKIRLGDKMNRFASLINGKQQVSDESIRDTLVDLANYAAMTVKWLDSKTNKEG